MDYGQLIKRATEITWRHKVLWVFGIAAALAGGASGGLRRGGGEGFQYVFSGDDATRWRRATLGFPGWRYAPWGPGSAFGSFPSERLAPIVLGVLAVAFVLAIVLLVGSIVVRYTSFGALVGMVNEVEETDRTSFKSGLRTGWRRLLRLFAIDLIIAIVVGLLLVTLIVILILGALFVAAPIAWLASSGRGAVAPAIIIGVGVGLGILLLAILASVAVSAMTTLVRQYAFRSCVIDMRGVFDSLGAAMRLMSHRFRESVLMWLLLVAIEIALGLLAIPLALLGAGGVLAPSIAVWDATRSVGAAIVAAAPGLFVLIVVGSLVSGIYLAFRSAVWTLTFRELRAFDLPGDQLPPETVP